MSSGPREVLGLADARDLGRGLEDRVGDLARDDVDLVRVRHRDHEVGVLGAGGEERRGMGRVAGHRADVEAVLQLAQDVVAGVDDGDVVRLLARQLLRGGAADLARLPE